MQLSSELSYDCLSRLQRRRAIVISIKLTQPEFESLARRVPAGMRGQFIRSCLGFQTGNEVQK